MLQALKQALMDLNFVEDAYMQANEKSEDYAERVHEKEEEIAFLEGKVIKLEAALKVWISFENPGVPYVHPDVPFGYELRIF